MEKEPKIYVGNGKKNVDFARKISVCLTDLPQEHIFEYNGKKYIKLEVMDKRETDQWGKNVSVSVDTWKPDPAEKQEGNEVRDNLPF